MSERWVKTVTANGNEQWINMGRAIALRSYASPNPNGPKTFIELGDDMPDKMYQEPPEHFLPPSAIELEKLRAFVQGLAWMRDDETVKPDGSGIVRDAKALIEWLRALDAKRWAAQL